MSWSRVQLGHIADIVSGATPKTGIVEYWAGDIPWVTPADLSNLGEAFIGSTARMITKAGLASCAATLLPEQSILLSSRAPIGHVAINSVPMATNQGFKSLVPHRDVAEPKYLYHWLKANTNYLQSLGNGATFKEVSKATVARVEVPLPPLDEQRRIAGILDHVESLRTKHLQAEHNSEELASAVFDQLFGDPIANPKGWPVHRFGELALSMQYGPRFYNESYSPEGIRIVRITDLDHAGYLDFGSMPKMSVTDDERRKFELTAGDIIFARTGATVGKLALIKQADPPCIAGAYFIRIQLEDCLEPDFAAAFLRSRSIQSIIEAGSHQSAQQNFSGPGLRALPCPLPPIELQRQFSSLLAKLGEDRSPRARAASALDELFVSLQYRAFSGQL